MINSREFLKITASDDISQDAFNTFFALNVDLPDEPREMNDLEMTEVRRDLSLMAEIDRSTVKQRKLRKRIAKDKADEELNVLKNAWAEYRSRPN